MAKNHSTPDVTEMVGLPAIFCGERFNRVSLVLWVVTVFSCNFLIFVNLFVKLFFDFLKCFLMLLLYCLYLIAILFLYNFFLSFFYLYFPWKSVRWMWEFFHPTVAGFCSIETCYSKKLARLLNWFRIL